MLDILYNWWYQKEEDSISNLNTSFRLTGDYKDTDIDTKEAKKRQDSTKNNTECELKDGFNNIDPMFFTSYRGFQIENK